MRVPSSAHKRQNGCARGEEAGRGEQGLPGASKAYRVQGRLPSLHPAQCSLPSFAKHEQ